MGQGCSAALANMEGQMKMPSSFVILLCLALSSCTTRPSPAPILLFTGSGTSPNDVAAIESILDANHLSYATATSRQLNAMTEADLREYQLLIVPGGNFIDMGKSLNSTTAANIRRSVENGTNYLGICAGAFLAGDSAPNALNLTSGTRFHFYSAEDHGIRKTSVAISHPNGQSLDTYWEDGPQLTGWGEIVSKYPDGTPAVVQGRSGQGFVVLTGVHPEAPESWRRGLTFHSPISADHEYASALIHAALTGTSLPHF